MKKFLLHLHLTLLILSFLAIDVRAQQERCTQNLEDAQLRYDEGRIQDVESLILSCLETKVYDKAQSVQALRLLILSSIFQEQEELADDLMLQLLETSHEFEPDQALDPTEFINLYYTYRTKPILNIGFHAGANLSFNDVMALHTVGQQGWKKEYTIVNGISAGLLYEWEFKPRWILYPELQYVQKKYTFTEEYMGILSNDVVATGNINETYIWVELPVSVQYVFTDNRQFKPYVFLGGTFGYLLSSEYPGDNTTRTREDAPVVQLSTVKSGEDRNRLSVSALAGAGVKIKLGEGYLTLEGRFNYQLTQLTIDEDGLTPSDNQDLVYGLSEWYNSFNQHTASLMVGYTKTFYNPKKLQ